MAPPGGGQLLGVPSVQAVGRLKAKMSFKRSGLFQIYFTAIFFNMTVEF